MNKLYAPLLFLSMSVFSMSQPPLTMHSALKLLTYKYSKEIMLLSAGIFLTSYWLRNPDSSLPTFDQITSPHLANDAFVQKTLQSLPAGIKAEVLSIKPPIILLRNFVTHNEAEQIKQLAATRMNASKTGIGRGILSDIRTSSNAFFHFEENATIKNIVQRAAQIIGYSANHSEVQVVHYCPGQQFKPHTDWFTNEKPWGTQRNVSYFIYLNSVPKSEGGETDFPIADVTVQPEKGAALLWSNIDDEGNGDARVVHAGCMLKNSEKWGVNLFFHDKVPYVNKTPYKYIFTISGKIQSLVNKFKRS